MRDVQRYQCGDVTAEIAVSERNALGRPSGTRCIENHCAIFGGCSTKIRATLGQQTPPVIRLVSGFFVQQHEMQACGRLCLQQLGRQRARDKRPTGAAVFKDVGQIFA